MNIKSLALALTALATAGSVHAANLVTNGSFETVAPGSPASFEFGNSFIFPNNVTGWSSPSTGAYNLYFDAATATTADAVSRFPGEQQRLSQLPSLSPDGGNFIALDGDTGANGPVQQLVNGLTAGKSYSVKFYWAGTQLSNRTGETTEQLFVTFGGDTQSTAVVTNPTHGFQGWYAENFSFTAHSSSQLLSFLSIGTPNGLPPVALLDGVSVAGVPEASTWVMLIAGFGLVGAAARRRRRTAATA